LYFRRLSDGALKFSKSNAPADIPKCTHLFISELRFRFMTNHPILSMPQAQRLIVAAVNGVMSVILYSCSTEICDRFKYSNGSADNYTRFGDDSQGGWSTDGQTLMEKIVDSSGGK
jgi:hypothetical protein